MRKKMLETIGAVIVTLLVILLLGIAGYHETHYTAKAEVVRVAGEDVYVVTEDGHEWEFFGEGFAVGDMVEMEMWYSGTDLNKIDDEITSVKKINS